MPQITDLLDVSDANGAITTANLLPAGAGTPNSFVALTVGGRDTLTVQVIGTYTGALSIQGTIDGTNWVTFGGAALIVNLATAATSATIASASTGLFQVGISGVQQVRVTALSAVTGTATLSLRAVDGNAQVALDAAIPAGSNAIGAVTITGSATVTPTTGTPYALTTAATTNAAVVKASAGSLFEVAITNTTAAAIVVKLYNKATAPTVGTDVPLLAVPVAVGSVATIGFPEIGKRFSAGIAIATTAAIATTDVAAISAGAIISATYL